MRCSIPPNDVAARKVLLATDFSVASRAAFRASLALCHQFGASLHILHVFDQASGAPSESGGLLFDSDRSYKDAEASIGLLVEEAQRTGVVCEGTLGIGCAHDIIPDVLNAQSCDLVVLGTRAIRGFERLVFGSTAEAVIPNAVRPVLTVGPQVSSKPLSCQQNAGIVVFATDFHVGTTEAIRYAGLFAKTMEIPFHCLHVLPWELKGTLSSVRLSSVITDALKHLVGRFDLQSLLCVYAIAHGSGVSSAVVDYARRHDARLIVMGVRRASLAASRVPEHIAYRVIKEATCPVLTLAFPIEPKTFGARLKETRQGVLDPRRQLHTNRDRSHGGEYSPR